MTISVFATKFGVVCFAARDHQTDQAGCAECEGGRGPDGTTNKKWRSHSQGGVMLDQHISQAPFPTSPPTFRLSSFLHLMLPENPPSECGLGYIYPASRPNLGLSKKLFTLLSTAAWGLFVSSRNCPSAICDHGWKISILKLQIAMKRRDWPTMALIFTQTSKIAQVISNYRNATYSCAGCALHNSRTAPFTSSFGIFIRIVFWQMAAKCLEVGWFCLICKKAIYS